MEVRRGLNFTLVDNYLDSQGIGAQDREKVAINAMDLVTNITSSPDFCTGLLLGKVQSGKTNGFLMSMALLSDNGFKKFVVLTSDDNWLYDQTVSRIRESGLALYVLTKDKFDDTENLDNIIDAYPGVVIVTTKNASQSAKVKDLIIDSNVIESEWILIDDEADQASLNTNENKPSLKPSRINSNITDIFDEVEVKAFIQVTATPQAILLQRAGTPFRPDFIITIEPGEDYVGGDIIFGDETKENYLRLYDSSDLNISIPIEDEEQKFPQALKDAINTFIVSATVKILSRKGNSFSFICNASLRQDDHQYIKNLIEQHLIILSRNLKKFDDNSSTGISLKKAYDDISSSVDEMPDFNELIVAMKDLVAINNVQVINTESITKQPDYSARYNFIVGGAKLSRGVTIKRLITTYYARETSSPKIDTVHQHARMYGYRKEDLDVTRVFLSEELSRRFEMINESDIYLRESISKAMSSGGIIPILIGTGMSATRPNVLSSDDIVTLRSGSLYFPHYPIFKKTCVFENTKYLDSKLKPFIGLNRSNKAEEVTIDFLIDLIRHTQSKNITGEFWSDNRIVAILEALKTVCNNRGFIDVKIDRKISNSSSRGISSLLEAGAEKRAEREYPTLYMYRLTGTSDLGWDDQEFWVPDLRIPNIGYIFMMGIEE